jgi:hypothetical protein
MKQNRKATPLWSCLLLWGAYAFVQTACAEEFADKLNFRLDDLSGVSHELRADGKVKVVAFVFLSTECPIARSYLVKLNALHASWLKESLPVKFFGVISDPYVTSEEAKHFADEFEVRFPILYDSQGRLAKNLSPSHVPEAFVLDTKSHLVYRGRIDDVYAEVGRRRPAATQNDLEEAVAAIVKDMPVKTPRTSPVGCPFEAWKTRGKTKAGE